MTTTPKANYRLGGAYALLTAFLLSTQEPFSSLAAKHLDTVGFVWVSQVALAVSIPLLLVQPKSRKDFLALLTDSANIGPLLGIFALGMTGLLLYNFGLANAHPIIIAAVLNLSPFWAALVALFISKVPIPASPLVFFGCLAGAFFGAMAIAWSQIGAEAAMSGLAESLLHGGWIYAVPIPILSALNGTLIARWFSRYDESAAIAANFLAPAVVLIPITSYMLAGRAGFEFDGDRSDCVHDVRDRRCGVDRARALSNCAHRHPRGQWLRHHVLPAGARADRPDLVRDVVLDSRPQIRGQRTLFRRARPDRVFLADLFLANLGAGARGGALIGVVVTANALQCADS